MTFPPTNALELSQITKSFSGAPVLRGVSLRAAAGEIVALLGPSGCGKTTLLRIIAGLEQADTGAVRFGGTVIDAVPVHQRGFGMMFQDYALFPHRDVADNIAFGLRMQGLPASTVAARVAEMLELVGMAGYERRRVYDLSGGERQRVALARALAPRPRLLMLDEPLAALDRALRERLQDELRAILRQVGVTSLYVTHDQQEAFALADRIILLNAGVVEQDGPPEAVYAAPASPWVARFLGLSNLIDGSYAGDLVETPLGLFRCDEQERSHAPGTPVTLLIYSDATSVVSAPPDATNVVRGVLVERQFRGRSYRVRLRHAGGIELSFDLDEMPGNVGDEVVLVVRTYIL